MRLLIAAFTAACLTASQAAALSCMRPDPVDAFARANAATEVYVIVLGQFSGGPGPRPEDPSNTQPENRVYDMTFTGHTLNRDGPAEPVNRTVRVVEQCVSAWCASVPTGQQVLTFLRVDAGADPLLEVGPCYPDFFTDPTTGQIDAIKDCFEMGCTAS